MGAQGSPYPRFRRALSTRNPTLAVAAAAELDQLPLEDALALTLLLCDREPARYSRAAAKWAGRFIAETPGIELKEAALALAAVGALNDDCSGEAAHLLGALGDRFDQPKVSESRAAVAGRARADALSTSKPVTKLSTRQRLPELRRHVDELAAQNGIGVQNPRGGRGRATRAAPSRGLGASVRLPEIKGQVTYLIALHELGHLLARGNRGKRQLEREAQAWRWAIENSLVELTPTTCRRIREYLKSYYERAVVKGMLGHRVVARIPDRESDYWELMAELGDAAGIETVVNEHEAAARRRLRSPRSALSRRTHLHKARGDG